MEPFSIDQFIKFTIALKHSFSNLYIYKYLVLYTGYAEWRLIDNISY